MPVSQPRRPATPRVDDDELGPAPAHRLDFRPEVHIGRNEVGAPGYDEIGMEDGFRVGSADRSNGHVPRRLTARVAHRAGAQPAGAERVEQAIYEPAVHLSLIRA